MSALSRAQPGCDGVLQYATTIERDAAERMLAAQRPELQLLPAGDLWLAWVWPAAGSAEAEITPAVLARRAAVEWAKSISRKNYEPLAEAKLHPGERQVLRTGTWTTCGGTFHAVRDSWSPFGLSVEYDAEADPGTVYVTYTGDA